MDTKIITAVVIAAFMIIFTADAATAWDKSEYAYKTVRVTGKLEKKSDRWVMGGRFIVANPDDECEPGYVIITGLTYPRRGKSKMLLLKPLKIERIKKTGFKIEKYEKPVTIKGNKARVIHQHPISGDGKNVGYFDMPSVQVVVYFQNDGDFEKYNALKEGAEVSLTGTFFPVFAHSKRPGGDRKKKYFYGFQMKVEGLETQAMPEKKTLELFDAD